ncbi:DUF1801 domain-containing protein [uncultured Maribacter sp.]|uniref:DUF1801 domain-containing protein n=1 Tax=uncultured Maribacter sp. TaxID=431308 RepID=UPI0026019DFB|nr:DUF1801 domain-containing protein [uncultured Maribacter sp.]
MKKSEDFYFNKQEPNKSCLLALRDIILKQSENITETTKYGMPCFCYHNKMFVYLWVDKKSTEPYILFVDGDKLIHSDLEIGKRAKMKIFRVNPTKDIAIEKLNLLLQMAIDLREK